jgi:hypothetical protein
MAAGSNTNPADAVTLGGQGIVTMAHIMTGFIAAATEADPDRETVGATC